MSKQEIIALYLILLVILVPNGAYTNYIGNIGSEKNKNSSDQAVNVLIPNTNFPETIFRQSDNKTNTSKSGHSFPDSTVVTPVNVSTNETGFISTWNTLNFGVNSSDEYHIKLPLESDGTYDFNVSWGDGTTNTITTNNQSLAIHKYKFFGTYNLTITGTIIGWRFNGTGDRLKLIKILNWGPLRLGNGGYYFSDASNLVITALDALNLNGTTNLTGMFYGCSSLGSSGNLNTWNVSQVTDMNSMFEGDYIFNQSITNWNVSQVTNMAHMFSGASSFNQSIVNWNVSQVADMNGMFEDALNFNKPIGNWKVSKVTNMRAMFADSSNFNRPIGTWNVSQVNNMANMFEYAQFFNQPIGKWNVSNVTNMANMFSHTSEFNQSIENWNVSKVKNMGGMFFFDSSFNQPIGNWNVSQVTNMSGMFEYAYVFNQPLSNWNVSQVTDMKDMFSFASVFNQTVESWDVSQVTTMSGMFQCSSFYGLNSVSSSFNQPLDLWNVSHVTNMSYMFDGASSFNQPLENWDVGRVKDMSNMFAYEQSFNQPIGDWNVSQVTDMFLMFQNASLSNSNYDQLLVGWSSLPFLQHNLFFYAGSSHYTSSARNAREKLINMDNWTIYDGGLAITTANRSTLSSFNLFAIIGLILITTIVIIGLSTYLSIVYLYYKKNKKKGKGQQKYLSYWIALRNSFKLRKHQKIQYESLSDETLVKIEEIIKENKEK